MSIAVVQADSSADLAAPCTMGAALTQGHWLAMMASAYNGTAYPGSPTVGGSAIAPVTALQGGSLSGSNSVAYSIWVAKVTSAMAGQTLLSFSAGAGGGPIKLYGIEFSATGPVSVDRTAVGTGAGGGSETVGPTAAASSAGELAIFTLPVFNADPVVTAGGFTIIGDQNYAAGGYQILGAAGATASVTATIPAADWGGGIVTLQQVGTDVSAALASALAAKAAAMSGAETLSGHLAAALAAKAVAAVGRETFSGHLAAALAVKSLAAAGGPGISVSAELAAAMAPMAAELRQKAAAGGSSLPAILAALDRRRG